MITRRDVIYISAGWALVAIAAGVQNALYAAFYHTAMPWPDAFRNGFIDWGTCAIFTPVFVYVVQRWPLGRSSGWRAWSGYALIVAFCTVAKFAIELGIWRLLGRMSTDTLTSYLLNAFVFQFYAFAAVIGTLLALVYYRSFRDRETRAAQLEAALSTAQLNALRVQLQPHFLFNTLNSVAALMHVDVDAADDMLGRLSDLLRLTLRRGSVQEIELNDELATLERYVDIMRVRFRDNLTVEIDVDEKARHCVVPNFILQPLLENAIEHGVDRVLGRCTVRLRGSIVENVLTLEVSDHGPGLPGGRPENVGIGLSNTRDRLAALYGTRASLQILPTSEAGVTVVLRLPARVLERV
jgi:two-component system, LytTR family, sensor kinase